MANDHGEMARPREREKERMNIYFKQISLVRARCIYVAYKTGAALGPAAVCIYRLDALREDSPLLSLEQGRVSNLKGLKRFPRRVWRVGLSALEHRSTDADSFSPPSRT